MLFTSVNTETRVPYPPPKSFRLATPPKTDIYAAPAHGYVWTAPIVHRKINTALFKKARVTVSFNYSTIYDQAGLIIVFPTKDNPNPDSSNAGDISRHPQWVKAGIEINDGKPWASVVTRENWADWSLSSPPEGVVESNGDGKGSVRAVIEFERHENALFIYASGPEGEDRSMIRELQWVFMEGRDDREAYLGVYTCSPDPEDERKGQPLTVSFEDFAIIET